MIKQANIINNQLINIKTVILQAKEKTQIIIRKIYI